MARSDTPNPRVSFSIGPCTACSARCANTKKKIDISRSYVRRAYFFFDDIQVVAIVLYKSTMARRTLAFVIRSLCTILRRTREREEKFSSSLRIVSSLLLFSPIYFSHSGLFVYFVLPISLSSRSSLSLHFSSSNGEINTYTHTQIHVESSSSPSRFSLFTDRVLCVCVSMSRTKVTIVQIQQAD